MRLDTELRPGCLDSGGNEHLLPRRPAGAQRILCTNYIDVSAAGRAASRSWSQRQHSSFAARRAAAPICLMRPKDRVVRKLRQRRQNRQLIPGAGKPQRCRGRRRFQRHCAACRERWQGRRHTPARKSRAGFLQQQPSQLWDVPWDEWWVLTLTLTLLRVRRVLVPVMVERTKICVCIRAVAVAGRSQIT